LLQKIQKMANKDMTSGYQTGGGKPSKKGSKTLCSAGVAGVKEGPADCIRIDEVAAALKKMKRHKAPGLSRLVAEMIQATGDIATQEMLDLCNGIVKEGCN